MKQELLWVFVAAIVALPAGAPLAADVAAPQQQRPAEVAPVRPYDIVLEIGAGAASRPAYEGAKDYKFSPTGFVVLHKLWLPGFGVVKDGRTTEGFSFGPSFRYVPKRDSSDYTELRGLNDVDAAYELGGKVSYTFGMIRPRVAVRYGLGGHHGVVGEAALDFIFRPGAATEFTIGPHASFASAEYMRTYLGVSPTEAARSGLRTYDPNGGIKGAGAQITGRHEFTPEWSLVGSLVYEKLVGDAADSPIVKVGDNDQFTAKLGLTYKFGLMLFNNKSKR